MRTLMLSVSLQLKMAISLTAGELMNSWLSFRDQKSRNTRTTQLQDTNLPTRTRRRSWDFATGITWQRIRMGHSRGPLEAAQTKLKRATSREMVVMDSGRGRIPS